MNIEREALITVLERVKPALQSSGSIPELKHIWLDGKFLYAYDGALGIRIVWETELTPCGLPGAILLGLLNSSSAKEVSLEQEGGTQLVLKMGRSSTTIPILTAQSNPWPFPAKVPAGPVGVLPLTLTEEFLVGLRRARVIKASNPVRVEHYGVVLFPNKDAIVLYATDSRSLVEVSVKGKYAKELAKAVLPHGFVTQLLLLKPPAKVSFLQDAIIAEATGVQVCSNLLDSEGVWDLPKLADDTVNGVAEGDPMKLPASFGEALNRGIVLAGPDTAYVTLTVGKKELELTGKLAHGLLKEKFPLSGTVTPGAITVGLEALKSLHKEAEEFAIAKKALILYGKDDALYLVASHEEK